MLGYVARTVTRSAARSAAGAGDASDEISSVFTFFWIVIGIVLIGWAVAIAAAFALVAAFYYLSFCALGRGVRVVRVWWARRKGRPVPWFQTPTPVRNWWKSLCAPTKSQTERVRRVSEERQRREAFAAEQAARAAESARKTAEYEKRMAEHREWNRRRQVHDQNRHAMFDEDRRRKSAGEPELTSEQRRAWLDRTAYYK